MTLREMAHLVGPYIGHRADCSFGATNSDEGDFCTCGLAAMKAKVRGAVQAERSREPSKGAIDAAMQVYATRREFKYIGGEERTLWHSSLLRGDVADIVSAAYRVDAGANPQEKP
jgi:hypothetical protein